MSDSLNDIIGMTSTGKPVQAEDEVKLVVRLRTCYYHTARGLFMRKEITYLKKLSKNYNIFEEDANNFGADEVISRIVDLNSKPDGIYEVRACNFHTDWETGYVDDYDYCLTPIKPEKRS
jgi:hypothetical protein